MSKVSLFLGIAGAALGVSDYMLSLPGWIDLDATGRLFVASVVCSIVAALTGCAGIFWTTIAAAHFASRL